MASWKKIPCPILLIQGQLDCVIPFHQYGLPLLRDTLKDIDTEGKYKDLVMECFPENFSHNNIDYYESIKSEAVGYSS